MKTLPPIPNGLITGSGTYYFTEGTIKGVLYAAQTAINNYAAKPANESRWNACKSTIDATKLAGVMLSILPGEATASTSSSSATSPMVLSRYDALNHYKRTHDGDTKSLNIRMYSHMELANHKRAHWSPGVGPWQIDFFDPAKNLNHAERADITIGGVEVAALLLLSHCSNVSGERGLKDVLNGRWHGCKPEKVPQIKDKDGKNIRVPDVCYKRYIQDDNRIYKNGKLNIQIVPIDSQGIALDQVDGGIDERLCRWDSDFIAFPCYIYNTGSVQGDAIEDSPDGTSSGIGMTPYPSPFISMTDFQTGTKYAMWPKRWPNSTAHTSWPKEIVTSEISIYRAVKRNEFVRCSPGRDLSPEPKGHEDHDQFKYDCAEGTYRPFGTDIENISFRNGAMIVEGWFDDSVPFQDGPGESDRHHLQVENCRAILKAGIAVIYCWWVDI